ncbi:MAG: bacillithiol system redox-active protein YtxJ [Bacteroidia bacterium]
MWDYTRELDIQAQIKDSKSAIILKHSNRCSISSMALNRMLSSQAELDESAHVYLIDVVANRALSLKIADDLNINHESPQVIVIKNGEVVHTSSHMGVNPKKVLSYL